MKSISVFLRDGFHTVVDTESHQFFADEPRDQGGEDSGPNPYDLLLASLGTCTAMTIRLYADGKKWPVESIRVTLRHRRSHLKDCEDCGDDHLGSFVDHIERELRVEGPLAEDQRSRLLDIADRCPVARTLKNGPRIDSRLMP